MKETEHTIVVVVPGANKALRMRVRQLRVVPKHLIVGVVVRGHLALAHLLIQFRQTQPLVNESYIICMRYIMIYIFKMCFFYGVG